MVARRERERELKIIADEDPDRLCDLLTSTLEAAGGCVMTAAERVGISVATFEKLLIQVGADTRVSLPPSPAFRKWFRVGGS